MGEYVANAIHECIQQVGNSRIEFRPEALKSRILQNAGSDLRQVQESSSFCILLMHIMNHHRRF